MWQISYLNHIWTAFVWRQICFFAQCTLPGSEQQLLSGLAKNNYFPCKWVAYNILVSEQQWGIRLASSNEVWASKQQLLLWASEKQWIAVSSWATKQQLHFGLARTNALFERVTRNNYLG